MRDGHIVNALFFFDIDQFTGRWIDKPRDGAQLELDLFDRSTALANNWHLKKPSQAQRP
jgi:hypothetical protein